MDALRTRAVRLRQAVHEAQGALRPLSDRTQRDFETDRALAELLTAVTRVPRTRAVPAEYRLSSRTRGVIGLVPRDRFDAARAPFAQPVPAAVQFARLMLQEFGAARS